MMTGDFSIIIAFAPDNIPINQNRPLKVWYSNARDPEIIKCNSIVSRAEYNCVCLRFLYPRYRVPARARRDFR